MEFKPQPSDQDEHTVPVTVNSGNSNGPVSAPMVRDQMLNTSPAAPAVTAAPTPPDLNEAQPPTPPVPAPQPVPTAGTPPPPVQDQPAQPQPPASQPLPPKQKHGRPKGAIIAAILIFLLLAGLSVFAYMKTKNKAEAPASKPAATNQNVQGAVTPQDVDKTNEELDKNLNSASDTSDINQNDLSDRTLGL